MKKIFSWGAYIAGTALSLYLLFAICFLPQSIENTNDVCQAHVVRSYLNKFELKTVYAGDYLMLLHEGYELQKDKGPIRCVFSYWGDMI